MAATIIPGTVPWLLLLVATALRDQVCLYAMSNLPHDVPHPFNIAIGQNQALMI